MSDLIQARELFFDEFPTEYLLEDKTKDLILKRYRLGHVKFICTCFRWNYDWPG